MASPLESLIATGTKLWLDSIDPELVAENRRLGATGATSNPVIVADLIKSGRFDDRINAAIAEQLEDDAIAWKLTDDLVREAQAVFQPVWESTAGNDGYVSFELDPLVEDDDLGLSHEQRVARYVELGKQWSQGHSNRMIKVPATAAGIACLEPLVAAGVTVNVTLLFTSRQYQAARDAVWRGAQQRKSLDQFKSVYSIFVSRVDVYSAQHCQLNEQAQGWLGIVNAKRIWAENQAFWKQHATPLQQELIFASTGTKDPADAPWKYVAAFAGSDIETNPPGTNDVIQNSDVEFTSQIAEMPEPAILEELDAKVDEQHLEETLMREGVQKFADPQKALLELISDKRAQLQTS